jgi:hypothetical protein
MAECPFIEYIKSKGRIGIRSAIAKALVDDGMRDADTVNEGIVTDFLDAAAPETPDRRIDCTRASLEHFD